MNFEELLYGCDTAEIADALDQCGIEGACLGVKSINKELRMLGPAYTVQYRPHDEQQPTFSSSSSFIDNVPADAIVVIDNAGRTDCTVWGDISTQLALMRNVGGTLVFGAVRDVRFIRETNYPVYAKDIYMRSVNGRAYQSKEQIELSIEGIKIKPGDIILGDENGVVVIPLERLEEVAKIAHRIKMNEQAMIVAVKSGMKFADVKKHHPYDGPWLRDKD